MWHLPIIPLTVSHFCGFDYLNASSTHTFVNISTLLIDLYDRVGFLPVEIYAKIGYMISAILTVHKSTILQKPNRDIQLFNILEY